MLAVVFFLAFVCAGAGAESSGVGAWVLAVPHGPAQVELKEVKVALKGIDLEKEHRSGPPVRGWEITAEYGMELAPTPQPLAVLFPFAVLKYGEVTETNFAPGIKPEPSGSVYGPITLSGSLGALPVERVELPAALAATLKSACGWPCVGGEKVTLPLDFGPARLKTVYRAGADWEAKGFVAILHFAGLPRWKDGKVGKFTVDITPGVPFRPRTGGTREGIELSGGRVDGKTFHWEKKDLAVAEALLFRFETPQHHFAKVFEGYSPFTREGQGNLKALPPRKKQELRDAVYAKHGFKFKPKRFAGEWWYSPNPAFTPSLFTDFDRKMLELLK